MMQLLSEKEYCIKYKAILVNYRRDDMAWNLSLPTPTPSKMRVWKNLTKEYLLERLIKF